MQIKHLGMFGGNPYGSCSSGGHIGSDPAFLIAKKLLTIEGFLFTWDFLCLGEQLSPCCHGSRTESEMAHSLYPPDEL